MSRASPRGLLGVALRVELRMPDGQLSIESAMIADFPSALARYRCATEARRRLTDGSIVSTTAGNGRFAWRLAGR
jgi:hypothetical protein